MVSNRCNNWVWQQSGRCACLIQEWLIAKPSTS